ncbi:DUF7159 family protein [Mycolicibacterium sp. XJ1819]
MDLVLGLSMTSTAVRWVLVEGTTGEGATVDRGAFDLLDDIEPEDLLDVVLVDRDDDRFHAIGVTWTDEADSAASGMLDALAARGFGNVIAVSELEAGDVLAHGIADITEYDDVAVCIVEPDAAVVATVSAEGVAVDRIGRALDGTDVVELPSSVISLLELDNWQPEAIFVVGSAEDLDMVVSSLESLGQAPVISAAEADIAMARGAALASARAVNGLAAVRPRLPSRIGALASVLVAASVTFVVTLSAAISLGLTPGSSTGEPQAANAVDGSASDQASAAATATAAPASEEPARVTTPREARFVVAQTIAMAVPPAPEAPAPAYEPPAYTAPEPEFVPPEPEYTAPAPAYTPPAPAYVPPVPQKPRLRDRIIERIPIINRFHEPEYPGQR